MKKNIILVVIFTAVIYGYPQITRSQVGLNTIYLPLIQTPIPDPSISRYVYSSPVNALNWGRNEALADNGEIVVILNFGQPWFQDDTHGVLLFEPEHPFMSLHQIKANLQAFFVGYSSGINSPLITKPPYLILVAGTNNYGSLGYVNSSHGQAWAEMINEIDYWLHNCGEGYTLSTYMTVVGGIDLELDWNDPVTTKSWVNGYDSVTDRPYYNYGTCEGCPFEYPEGGGCPNCIPNNQWSMEDVWLVSWGLQSAWTMPEIYTTNRANAYQWQNLSKYAYINQRYSIVYVGSVTQWGACTDPIIGCNPGEDNEPLEGWKQFYDALNSTSITSQSLPFATDFMHAHNQ